MSFYSPRKLATAPFADKINNKIIRLDVWGGVDISWLHALNEKWIPIFTALGEDDFLWDIKTDVDYLQSLLLDNKGIFCITMDKSLQGIMLVSEGDQQAATLWFSGKPFLEVRLLVTAPWNRGRCRQSNDWAYVERNWPGCPYLAGIGRYLISVAVDISDQAGFSGRIGLKALHSAVAFYQNQCRLDLREAIPRTGLAWMTLDENVAAQFFLSGVSHD